MVTQEDVLLASSALDGMGVMLSPLSTNLLATHEGVAQKGL